MKAKPMRKLVLAAFAGAGVAVAGAQPAAAYRVENHPAPWCAVISLGNGDAYWDCRYASLEACRPNVLAGNRGFCNENPYAVGWNEPISPRAAAKKKRHSRPY